jgi:hypothetical protein
MSDPRLWEGVGPEWDVESDPFGHLLPKPEHTLRDLVRQTWARQEPTVCWTKTCWCGHLMPDWLELCFTCSPEEKARWVK